MDTIGLAAHALDLSESISCVNHKSGPGQAYYVLPYRPAPYLHVWAEPAKNVLRAPTNMQQEYCIEPGMNEHRRGCLCTPSMKEGDEKALSRDGPVV